MNLFTLKLNYKYTADDIYLSNILFLTELFK